MNALIRFKNVAPPFVIALSLVTATATTTDVIFSFEEDNGEYADTDLETDSSGKIHGRPCLAAIMEVARCFSSARHLTDGFRMSCRASLGAPMEASRTKELASIARGTCTARQSPAGLAVVKAVAA